MRIMAFDIGSIVAGVAYGDVGSMPKKSESIVLRKGNQDLICAFDTLQKWFLNTSVFFIPEVIVVEAYLSKLADGNTNARTLLTLAEVHGAVKFIAKVSGAEFHEVHGNTIKKHFIGKVSAAPKVIGGASSKQRALARAQTKSAIVQRAQLLGYFPKTIYDEDRADACAIYDHASAVLFRKPIKNFEMFGG